jgi:hypothetical protein
MPDPQYPWALMLYGEKGTLKVSPASYDFVPDGNGKSIHKNCIIEREKYPEDVTEPDGDLQAAPATRANMKDFLAAIESRGKPVADIETAHISTASCILANISMELDGRPLRYDPAKREVPGDPQATKLLRRDFRAPSEFRRNRPRRAVARDGVETGRTAGGALARTQRIAGGRRLCAGLSAASAR